MHPDWERVTRQQPCRICGKPDYCLISRDGNAAICGRVESQKQCGEAGWRHRLRDRPFIEYRAKRHEEPPKVPPTWFEAFIQKTKRDGLERLPSLARELGLSLASLNRLDVGWSHEHRAFSFPMRDYRGMPTGCRLRPPQGRKFSVKNGRGDGLFMPNDLPLILKGQRLCICEGPTDTAALLDLGYTAIGRPSCRSGNRQIVYFIRSRKPLNIVIFADRDLPKQNGDLPGQRGAADLAATLRLYIPVLIVLPPAPFKDVREWYRSGATTADVEAEVENMKLQKREI